MERLNISKCDKQTIFEIYRACRLCGAGGGYRMPIIQNIVDFGGSDVELTEKIQDCLQIEVRPDDRMPPLICELCVEKLNDFHDFMRMARQTNIRTRTKLGLPLQAIQKIEKVETNNSLAAPEPVNEQPVPKKSRAGPKCSKKVQKEVEPAIVKEERTVPSPRESRSSSGSSRARAAFSPQPTFNRQPKPSPKLVQPVNPPTQPNRSQPTKTAVPKVTQVMAERRGGKERNVKEKETIAIEVKPRAKISRKELADLLQDTVNFEENTLLVPRAQKRLREHEIPKPLMVPKRSKMSPREPVQEVIKEPTPPRPRPRPKSKQDPKDPKNVPMPLKIPKVKPKPLEPPKTDNVNIPIAEPLREEPVPKKSKAGPKCSKILQEIAPVKTKVEPPKTYHCTICSMQLKTVQALSNHTRHHVPNYTKPQYACNPCGKWFPSYEEATAHHRHHRASTFPYHCRRCFEDFRALPEYELHITNGLCIPWETVPDVKCEECWKTFPTDNLRMAHKCPGTDARPGGKCANCSRTYATLKTLKKHESTCNQRRKRDLIADPDVLRRLKPMQVRISRCDDLLASPGGCNVSAVKPNYGLDKQYVYPYMRINTPVTQEPARGSYTHWDSEDSDDDIKRVDSLAALALRKLFSKNLLGKVPRKHKKNKTSSNISDIIGSLNAELGCDTIANRNELLMASIKNIIGVTNVDSFDVFETEVKEAITSSEKGEVININAVNDKDSVADAGNDSVDRNENDADVYNTKTVSNEKGDLSNENAVNDVDSLSGDMGNEIITGNANDVDMQETKNVSSEKSVVENVSHVANGAEDVYNLTKDIANENLVRNDADISINETKTVSSEESELSNDVDSCKVTENEIAARNEIEANVHESSSDKSERFSASDCINDADDGSSYKETENTETVDRSEYVDVNTNELKTVPSEQNELTDINGTSNDVKNVDSLSKGTEEIELRNKKDVNINESNALSDKNEISNENYIFSKDVVMENADLNTNDRYRNESDVALNEESDVTNRVDTEIDSEGVNITSNRVSDNSTNLHLIERDNINNEESNDENVNDEETIKEKVSSNQSAENYSENVDTFANIEESIKEVNNHNPIDLDTQLANLVEEVNNVNGINDHGKDGQSQVSYRNESDNKEVNSLTNNESAIKHSIENIIGETDKNPDKYINEVISSLENIIMKNPRNESPHSDTVNGEQTVGDDDMDDQSLMDALDAQIGDEARNTSDSEKITLDDLLPKEHRKMELDDISDEDFNFDD